MNIIDNAVKKSEIINVILNSLIKSGITAAVTGRQGSGKTTFLKSMISLIPEEKNIRVSGAELELSIREEYKTKNIMAASELVHQEEASHTDVTLIDGIFTDADAKIMIENINQNRNHSVICTHHAIKTEDLVRSLRDSLVTAGGYDNIGMTEHYVAEAIKINVHMRKKFDGNIVIGRISEIIASDVPYANSEHVITQSDSFCVHNIVTYNEENNEYRIVDGISDKLYDTMCKHITESERIELDKVLGKTA